MSVLIHIGSALALVLIGVGLGLGSQKFIDWSESPNISQVPEPETQEELASADDPRPFQVSGRTVRKPWHVRQQELEAEHRTKRKSLERWN